MTIGWWLALVAFILAVLILVIMTTGIPFLSTGRVMLTYNPFTRDDPGTLRAKCLDLLTKCYRPPPQSWVPCIRSISTCEKSAGNCCPQACIEAFDKALASGMTEEKAKDASFLKGDCIPGFSEWSK